MSYRISVLAVALWVVLSAPAQGFSVNGGRLVGSDDRPIQLRGVNWFGFETKNHVVHGLWARNWKELVDQLKAEDINAIRLPVCPDTLHAVAVPPGSIDYDLNPDLRDLDSLGVLDALVHGLDARGIYVLLDHHRPDCEGIAELWYTPTYSEKAWITDLEFLARRYRDVSHVIGIDLKNEPHGTATWGTGSAATDFNVAAERAAQAVVRQAPNWLVFVEGVQENPSCSGSDPHFWGENLAPMACTPLRVPPDRLVLAPHTYGPDVHAQPYFDVADFPHNLAAIRDRNFGQFLSQGYAVILGEFGGKYGEGDLRDRVWQDTLVDYLIGKGVRSGFYWALNPNSGDTGGLLRDDWKTWRNDKLELLHRLWNDRVDAPAAPNPAGTIAAPAPTVEVRAGVTVISDWGAGYCAQVEVRTGGEGPVLWRTKVPIDGHIDQLWNAVAAMDGSFSGKEWNAQIGGDRVAHFGFCANRAPRPAPIAKATGVPDADPALQLRLAIDSDWGAGYCARVEVQNTGQQEREWHVSIAVEGRIRQTWKAQFSGVSGTVTVTGESYNRRVRGGGSADFGFCASRELPHPE